MVARAVVGTALAVSTIVLAALYRASPAILGDLLGVVYALWLAGWIADRYGAVRRCCEPSTSR